MGLVLIPLSFLLIGYVLIFFLIQPIFRPVSSLYSLVSSQNGPNFISSATNLYNGESGEIKDFELPDRGSVYARLVADSINANLDLYYGDSDKELNRGLGTYPGSSLPGFGKTIIVAGHTVPFLKNMGQFAVGDTIQIDTFYGTYKYEVYDIKIGRYDDSSMYDMEQEEKEILVLYTCYPLDGIGFKPERMFVYANKIEGPSVNS